MKKIILSILLFFTAGKLFSQTFMQGAGITVFAASPKNGKVSIGETVNYSPRFTFLETESLSASVGIPLGAGISFSTYIDPYYSGSDVSFGLVLNTALIVNLNIGRGSTKENRDKLGYFIGAGFGYYHADFKTYNDFGETIPETTNAYGPAGNAGLRFGIGKEHQSVEVIISYMKGLNESKPDVFGLGCAFNF
jgi:hypothetical protein